eukprot:8169769-Pyramimonas_sp.AAC.1
MGEPNLPIASASVEELMATWSRGIQSPTIRRTCRMSASAEPLSATTTEYSDGRVNNTSGYLTAGKWVRATWPYVNKQSFNFGSRGLTAITPGS